MVPLDSLHDSAAKPSTAPPTRHSDPGLGPGEADALPSRCLLSQHVMALCKFCVCCHFHENAACSIFSSCRCSPSRMAPWDLGSMGQVLSVWVTVGVPTRAWIPRVVGDSLGEGRMQVRSSQRRRWGSWKVLSWLMTLLWLWPPPSTLTHPNSFLSSFPFGPSLLGGRL